MPKTAHAKELQKLEEKIAQQALLLAEKEQTICKLKEEQKTREFEDENRIPIPKGQAGRREGYKLFDEMGVSKETFQAIRTIVRYTTSRFLDVTKTIRYQDAKRLKHTLFQITNTVPFLSKYYESSWPIRPIMRQYLSSTHRAHKKAVRYMKTTKQVPTHFANRHLKGKTTQKRTKTEDSNRDKEDDNNAESEDEDNHTENNNAESEDNNDEDDSDDLDDDDDDGTDMDWKLELTEIEREAKKKLEAAKGGQNPRHISKTRAKNTIPVLGGSNMKPAEGGSNTKGGSDVRAKNMIPALGGSNMKGGSDVHTAPDSLKNGIPVKSATKMLPKKKSVTAQAEKENIAQTDPTGMGLEAGAVEREAIVQIREPEHQNSSQTTKPNVGKGKYPAHCSVCKGKFPMNPSEKVKALHANLQAALRDPTIPRYNNGEQKGVNFMRLELCVAIQADLDFQKSYSEADLNNWPAPGVVDFQRVYDRILNLNEDGTIWGLLANDIVLRNSDVEFKKIVDKPVNSLHTLQQFLAMPTLKKFNIIDCVFGGYYGPAGEEVILAVLRYHIFPLSKNSSTVLAATMTDVLDAEQESLNRTDFWKGFQPTMFSLEDFIYYVARPFVANLLICQDHLITEAEAEVIRLDSALYGRTVNPTNEKIDDLVMMIAAPQHQPSPLTPLSNETDNYAGDAREALIIPEWVARKQNNALPPLSPIIEDSPTGQKRPRSDDAAHEEQEQCDHPKPQRKRPKKMLSTQSLRRSTRHNISKA